MRRRLIAAIAVLCLLATTGCGLASRQQHPSATGVHELAVDGVTRSYRLYVPASATQGAPLVVMLHGGFGSAEQAEKAYGWDALADRTGTVVAYPDGLDHAWNVGAGCCGRPGSTGTDDVAAVSAVVADVASRVAIDPDRVFATGISNGGMMAYRLACDTSLFAAIAPDSATLLGACPHPSPISVLHLHGLADETVRFDGEPGTGRVAIDGPPVDDVIAAWRAVDRCAAPVSTGSGPVTASTATCPDGRAVELITIAGAGHQWPGSDTRTAVQRVLGTDPPSTALDATATIWEFFAAHGR